MARVSFQIKADNSAEVIATTKKALLRGLAIVGGKASEYAAQLAPVDTGLLHNSITYALAGDSPEKSAYTSDDGAKIGTYGGQVGGRVGDLKVHIGTNVEYAVFQEYGARGSDGKHYLENGIKTHLDEFGDILTEELRNLD